MATIDKIVPYPHTGSSSTKLVGQRAFDERFNRRARPVRRGVRGRETRAQQGRESRAQHERDGYAEAVRVTKERLHGEALFALTVGMLAGTICGVMYRELFSLVAGVLGY